MRVRVSESPYSPEDAVQIFLHLHQGASVHQEVLIHLLQPDVGQAVEVNQHLVGLLKAVQPVGRADDGPLHQASSTPTLCQGFFLLLHFNSTFVLSMIIFH